MVPGPAQAAGAVPRLPGGALGATIGVRPTLFAACVCATAGFLWLLPSPIPRMAALPATADAG